MWHPAEQLTLHHPKACWADRGIDAGCSGEGERVPARRCNSARRTPRERGSYPRSRHFMADGSRMGRAVITTRRRGRHRAIRSPTGRPAGPRPGRTPPAAGTRSRRRLRTPHRDSPRRPSPAARPTVSAGGRRCADVLPPLHRRSGPGRTHPGRYPCASEPSCSSGRSRVPRSGDAGPADGRAGGGTASAGAAALYWQQARTAAAKWLRPARALMSSSPVGRAWRSTWCRRVPLTGPWPGPVGGSGGWCWPVAR